MALDPNEPLAYAGLALGYARQGHGPNFAREAFPRARAAAEQALRLDSLLAEAHAALGEVKLYFDWDWDAAGRSFERAVALNPSMASAHSDLSWYFHFMGQPEKSLEHARAAEELDPLTPYYALAHGWLLWGFERSAEALRAVRDLERRAPEGKNLLMIAFIHAALGRDEDAFRWLRKACDDRVDWLPFAVSRSGYEMGPLVLKSLRGDPRFVEVADCVGVP